MSEKDKLVRVEETHKKQLPDGSTKEFKIAKWMKHAPPKPKPTAPPRKSAK